MNSLIGALIITMSLGGITPGTVPEEPSDFMPQIEEDGTLVFGPTKAEKEAEAKRIAEEEARKAEEERLRKEEEERKAKEEAMKNPENLNYEPRYSLMYKPITACQPETPTEIIIWNLPAKP